MTLALLPTIFSRAPWPKLFLTSVFGWSAVVSAEHTQSLPHVCSKLAALNRMGHETAVTNEAAVGLALSWFAMLLAMMPLLLSQPIVHLWRRSFPNRRRCAIATFMAAYFSMWMVAAPVMLVLAITLRMSVRDSEVLAVIGAALIALAWRASSAQQRCLNRCHVLPALPPFGFAAHRGVFMFGLRTGIWCIGACWALMLLPLVASTSHLLLMAVVTVLLLRDRLTPTRTPGLGMRRLVDRQWFNVSITVKASPR